MCNFLGIISRALCHRVNPFFSMKEGGINISWWWLLRNTLPFNLEAVFQHICQSEVLNRCKMHLVYLSLKNIQISRCTWNIHYVDNTPNRARTCWVFHLWLMYSGLLFFVFACLSVYFSFFLSICLTTCLFPVSIMLPIMTCWSTFVL